MTRILMIFCPWENWKTCSCQCPKMLCIFSVCSHLEYSKKVVIRPQNKCLHYIDYWLPRLLLTMWRLYEAKQMIIIVCQGLPTNLNKSRYLWERKGEKIQSVCVGERGGCDICNLRCSDFRSKTLRGKGESLWGVEWQDPVTTMRTTGWINFSFFLLMFTLYEYCLVWSL